jgi:hypothetical protein
MDTNSCAQTVTKDATATAASARIKERPIIFTAESVRAILEGRKTQTRRVAKLADNVRVIEGKPKGFAPGMPNGFDIRYPYGIVGDRLWVRETFCLGFDTKRRWSASDIIYAATADSVSKPHDVPWKSPMFMARIWSRITLEITDVRVQRVQEISKEDAIAEGISVFPLQSADDPSAWYQSAPGVNQQRSARASYAALWDSINAKRGFSWQSNCWVWVLSFKRV